MENTPLENKLITVKECGVGKTSTGKDMVNIKADGMYHIMFLKADGTESKAYQTVKPVITEMIGKEVGIGYAVSNYEVNGEQRTWKTIRVLDLTPDKDQYNQEQTVQVDTDLLTRLNALENRVGRLENNTPDVVVKPLESNTEPSEAPLVSNSFPDRPTEEDINAEIAGGV